MLRKTSLFLALSLSLAATGAALAQSKPASPRGTAATQVGGSYSGDRYTGGKWIEGEYSRPIKRGRDPLFGSGVDYGKKFLDGEKVWRLGANQTTLLKTEVPLQMGGKRLEPGTYSLFADLKESGWTLVVSKQPYQEKYDPNDKSGATWGSYGYDAKHDVARVPMKMSKSPHSIDQLTIGFVDVTDKGGALAIAWDKTVATADFTLPK